MKCIVIGMGTYGKVLVDELSSLGHEVIAADFDANRVERIKDKSSAAFQINAVDETALSILPLKKVDVVIVAIGKNLGASIRVVALLKKMGVEHIYARANDSVHYNILQAFDIERILTPEEQAARSLVRQMDLGVRYDIFRIDDKYCIFKFRVPSRFVGKMPSDLNLYMEFHLKIISITKSGKAQNCLGVEYNQCSVIDVMVEETPLCDRDELVCYGKESDFRKLCRVL